MAKLFWRYDSFENVYYYNEAGTWLIFPPIFSGQFKVHGPADSEPETYFFDTLAEAKFFVASQID